MVLRKLPDRILLTREELIKRLDRQNRNEREKITGQRTQPLDPKSSRPPTIWPVAWNRMKPGEREEEIEKCEAQYFPKQESITAPGLLAIIDDNQDVICEHCECNPESHGLTHCRTFTCCPGMWLGDHSEDPIKEPLALASGPTLHNPDEGSSNKTLIIEFCCSPSSTISSRAEHHKMQGIRLSLNRGNLSSNKYFDSVIADFQEWINQGYKIHL